MVVTTTDGVNVEERGADEGGVEEGGAEERGGSEDGGADEAAGLPKYILIIIISKARIFFIKCALIR